MFPFDRVFHLPLPALVFGGLVLLVAVSANAWSIRHAVRGRGEIRARLARDGFIVREMELRWLTRGPFPDMRPTGMRNSPDRLYYIVVDSPTGKRQTGWVRWRFHWPGQPDRWSVHWNDAAEPKRQGLSTVLFYSLVLAAMAIVISLIFRVASLGT